MSHPIQTYLLSRLPNPQNASRPELADFARLLRDYPLREGKLLRGRLLLLSAEAHGSSREAAMPLAAALELFQNWVLIHDDIEDDSDQRRGRPTLHHIAGLPLALNAGDALHATMWRVLAEAQVPSAVLEVFARMVETTALGQHLDLSWIEAARFDLTAADYFEMVHKKAAVYTVVAPLELGALISGATPHPTFKTAGGTLGAAFQIVDDALNLQGDPEGYGKEIAGDLWEGKRTLILLSYLEQAEPAERERAVRLLRLSRRDKSGTEVAWLHRQLLEGGWVKKVLTQAHSLAATALASLEPVFAVLPGKKAASTLATLLATLVERKA